MKYSKELQNIGLTTKQAQTYLACLKLGSSSVKPISELVELPRTTTYEVLEGLYKKGFINRLIKKKIRYYSVEDPRILIKKVKDNLEGAEKIVPDLLGLFMSAKVLPEVKLYEGKEAVINAWEEILQEGKKYKTLRVITNLQPFETLKKYFPKFRQKRKEIGLFSKILLTNTPESEKFIVKDTVKFQETKLLPENYKFNVSVDIIGDKIFFFSLKNEYTAVVVQNKEIAQTIATLFELIWRSIKN